MTAPLMPKATAVWLVENTTLTFKQIGDFCELHELEVQAIADGDVAFNIVGLNPVTGGQLTADEIARCEQDPSASLVGVEPERNVKAENSKNKKCFRRRSAATNRRLFCGFCAIVRKLSIPRYAS